MDLEIGMKAPNFSLKNHRGEKKINKNYQGKKLVIYFYPKDDTPGCTKESCRFRDINSEFNNYIDRVSKKYNIPVKELQELVNTNNNYDCKCLARKQDGEQCTRNKKLNSDYCGKHINNRKYGRVDDINLEKDNNIEKTHIENIDNINYLVDDDNYVYTNNIENPQLIGIKKDNSFEKIIYYILLDFKN